MATVVIATFISRFEPAPQRISSGMLAVLAPAVGAYALVELIPTTRFARIATSVIVLVLAAVLFTYDLYMSAFVILMAGLAASFIVWRRHSLEGLA